MKKHFSSMASAVAFGGTILCLSSAPARAGDGVDAIALLPQDTALVMSADIARLRSSKLAKDLFALVPQGAEVIAMRGKLASEGGLDLERDIDTVTIGMSGDIEAGDHIVLIAEGRFAKSKLVAFLEKDAPSFAQREHQGIRYYAVGDDGEFAFLGKYAVVTPKGQMTAIIDVHRGKAPSAKKNTALQGLMDKTYLGRGMWLALVLTDKMRQEIARDAGGHSINSMVLGVDADSALDVSARFDTSSAKAATALSTALSDEAKKMAGDPSLQMFGLAEVFSKMKVATNGAQMTVALSVPRTVIDQLLPIVQGLL